MINITLKQLRYFQALAHHRHFGRAADACAISQPALSMQIRDLEETLGQPLFERGARAVSLTGFGQRVATHARQILRGVDDLADLSRTAGGQFLDRLRLGVIPTIAPYLLPTVVRGLSQAYPGLDLHIRETLTPNLLRELTDGSIDAAIMALPVSEPSFVEKPLFTENFVLVRPQRDADKPVPDGKELLTMRLLLLEEGHCFRDQALAFCASQSGLPRDGLDASSLSTLVQMVGSGIGVTLIPEIATDVETRSAQVSVARFADPQPSRTVGMIWRRGSALAKQLDQASDVLQTALTDLQADGFHTGGGPPSD